MTNVSKIIGYIGHLSRQDVVAVRAACDRLLAENNAPAATPTGLYGVLLQVTGSKMPFKRFREIQYGKSWAENEKLFLGFIAQNWPGKPKVVEQALAKTLVQLLADDLKRCDLPVTVGTLAMNLHTIPDVFEYSFPGYRASGLADMILKG